MHNDNQRFGKKGVFLSPEKSAFTTKNGYFSQNVSEKGVFFRLGNADMSYLIHLSASTGKSSQQELAGYLYQNVVSFKLPKMWLVKSPVADLGGGAHPTRAPTLLLANFRSF